MRPGRELEQQHRLPPLAWIVPRALPCGTTLYAVLAGRKPGVCCSPMQPGRAESPVSFKEGPATAYWNPRAVKQRGLTEAGKITGGWIKGTRRTGNLKDTFFSFENLYCGYKKASERQKLPRRINTPSTWKEIYLRYRQSPVPVRILPGKNRTPCIRQYSGTGILIMLLLPVVCTRKKKGAHKAINRAQAYLRKNRW